MDALLRLLLNLLISIEECSSMLIFEIKGFEGTGYFRPDGGHINKVLFKSFSGH